MTTNRIGRIIWTRTSGTTRQHQSTGVEIVAVPAQRVNGFVVGRRWEVRHGGKTRWTCTSAKEAQRRGDDTVADLIKPKAETATDWFLAGV